MDMTRHYTISGLSPEMDLVRIVGIDEMTRRSHRGGDDLFASGLIAHPLTREAILARDGLEPSEVVAPSEILPSSACHAGSEIKANTAIRASVPDPSPPRCRRGGPTARVWDSSRSVFPGWGST